MQVRMSAVYSAHFYDNLQKVAAFLRKNLVIHLQDPEAERGDEDPQPWHRRVRRDGGGHGAFGDLAPFASAGGGQERSLRLHPQQAGPGQGVRRQQVGDLLLDHHQRG